MYKTFFIASLMLSIISFGQSITITGPDDESVKMEVSGFEDPTSSGEREEKSSQGEQPQWASVEGNQIILPDGRSFMWSYGPIDGMVGCELEMKAPMNARVELSYENRVAYTSEVPFFYREKAFQYFSSYIKLSVREASGYTWMVKLQNQKNKKITISDASASSGTPSGSNNQPQVISGAGGCTNAMPASAFNTALESIKSKSFEDTKLQVAKQVIRANCMSSNQIKQVMKAFTFEDTRLEYAIYAYRYCSDPNSFYLVNEAFEFELSIEELQEALEEDY